MYNEDNDGRYLQTMLRKII